MQLQILNGKLNLVYFFYEIVHHCNLNCKGCDHCAPIANEEFVDINKYKKDLKQLRKIFNQIFNIGIMGGEPLLHPNINSFLKETRRIYSKSQITLFTNGILLNSKDKKFWETLSKEKIVLALTKYNIDLDYKKIEETAKKYRVSFFYMDETNRKEKKFSKIKFDISGAQDIDASHKNCYHAQFCPQLDNGKFYKCPLVNAGKHFNAFFGTNMEEDEKDSINIYKRHKKEEIISYFENPIPYCKYCNVAGRENDLTWEKSKKEITEWT